MINNKSIILTVLGSLVLVALLAIWYSYETQTGSSRTTTEIIDLDTSDIELVIDNDSEDNLPEGEVEGIITNEDDIISDTITRDNNMINASNPVATIETNLGVIRLELFQSDMPITTDNFISLANDGFYDGIKFHRVIPGFMIQGGDPNTREDDTSRYGQGGPGYTIQDEFVEGDHLRNLPGTIAMANTGQPNSGGSQFFINVADNRNLDFDTPPMQSRHPVFGQVIDGMDVVQKIENVPTGARDIPNEPVIIQTISIEAN